MRRKGDLPSKPCATCGRPMVWRRAWAKVWDEVRHCSERCRRSLHSPSARASLSSVSAPRASNPCERAASSEAASGKVRV
ncbi:DUF2256 domain-containing protein [Rubellimicrobium sp. CFH 75288]|uniref:DUF2256 domain-containing protein n=1 Tax=Rubellimicrobium sp. CFH 75288 TaxID=2697034 RepID=UPI001412DC06|nr:DUF2256 domain-containing protein [Rubellimicrobium sp. CFH 75288]